MRVEDMHPPLESREPRNIVLSKFCSEIDRKFDVRLIACVYGTLDHIDCLKYHSCCLVSPVFVDCNILTVTVTVMSRTALIRNRVSRRVCT